ncbi:unnamed protein product [Nezara viridula]|uniref:BTB domain-containing protein n=1 Tax=Nezara viridula TaxID=85310 RepID=A0A9P0GYQ3_NEZVI|nr:unnamed protein product [Nezara viridula]
MGTNQQFSLRWNNYLHHITEAFDTLREDENLVDVTLCCEGRKIKAHKMLLSACSSYFREIFKENPCHHPIIVFHNVKYEDLWALVSFMYKGEVNVEQEGLSSFLNTAELLEVQGLTGGPSRTDETDDENSQDIKTNRKQNSPKSFARPESPVLKRRKLPTEDNLKKDHKTPLALVKTEPDFYGGDSHDESEDQKPQSLSLSQKLDKNYDNNYSDENMDGSSEIGSAGGSNNDMTNMQDSLQDCSINTFVAQCESFEFLSGLNTRLHNERMKMKNISHRLEVRRNLLGKSVRRICVLCYQKKRRFLDRQAAKRNVKKTTTYCPSCPRSPQICINCFNEYHVIQ